MCIAASVRELGRAVAAPEVGQGSSWTEGWLQERGDCSCYTLVGCGELQDSLRKITHLFSPYDSSCAVLKLTPTSWQTGAFSVTVRYYTSDSFASRDLFLELSGEAVYTYPGLSSPS